MRTELPWRRMLPATNFFVMKQRAIARYVRLSRDNNAVMVMICRSHWVTPVPIFK
jgi:hypothetical protein